MTNEQAEKHWRELVNKEISRYCEEVPIGDQTRFSIHKNAVRFVRANLSQVPEVRELVVAAKEMVNDCGCITPWRIELEEIVKKLEGGE